MLAISDHFKVLGAPLQMVRSSWGAVGEDGSIFVRCWQDEYDFKDKAVILLAPSWMSSTSPGLGERIRHIDAIKAGAQAYVVMCQPTDRLHTRIKAYNDRELFVGGEVYTDSKGVIWMRIVDRIPVTNLTRKVA